MSKLVSLFKAAASDGIQLFSYRGKTERSRRTVPFLLAMLMGVLIFFSAYTMTASFKEDGIAESTILSLYTLITSIIIVTEGVYKSGDLLFNPKDNDMLLAMPIKKSTIICVRIIKFYAFEMLYCLIFLLPAIIAYAMNAETGASYYLVAITMLILVPVIPITVSCVVGLISSAIAARFRRRSFLQVVLSFVALFALAAMIIISATPDFGGYSMVAISDKTAAYYYPASAFVGLATHFDWWQYLGFVAVNLVVLAGTIFVISRFYFQIVTRVNVVRRKENLEVKYKFRRYGQMSAMLRKELAKYFSTPVLVANTAIGLVLFVVGVGVLCLKFDDIAGSLAASEEFPLTIEEMRAFAPSITFALISFTSLMTFITTTMISLEGRAFNLLKSMPISGTKVLIAKILAAMLLIVPITAIGSLVMSVRFGFGFLDILLVMVAVIVVPLITETIGILIDLKYARFNADSEAEVVKQSPGVMIASFLGLGMTLLAISLLVGIVLLAGQTVGLVIMDGMFIVIALFLWLALATRGEEKYEKLTA